MSSGIGDGQIASVIGQNMRIYVNQVQDFGEDHQSRQNVITSVLASGIGKLCAISAAKLVPVNYLVDAITPVT